MTAWTNACFGCQHGHGRVAAGKAKGAQLVKSLKESVVNETTQD